MTMALQATASQPGAAGPRMVEVLPGPQASPNQGISDTPAAFRAFQGVFVGAFRATAMVLSAQLVFLLSCGAAFILAWRALGDPTPCALAVLVIFNLGVVVPALLAALKRPR